MNAFLHRFAWPAAILVAWSLTWLHLAHDWAADEQYRFGFGVPLLAAWIAWRRLPGPLAPPRTGAVWWIAVMLSFALLAMGAALSWHDPLWRLTGTLLQSGATILTIAWLQRAGGRPLVCRQLFPLLFAALAVPWPVPVELWTIRHLASAVTDIAVSAANLAGIPALQHGNTVELTTGAVGVDEACSGIQSLQAALMASLFLGEFFMLKPARRLALVAAGAALAFIANCTRVFALTVVAHRHGGNVSDGWHDFVGGTATCLIFALLLVTALFLARGSTPATQPRASSITTPMPEGIAVLAIAIAIPVAARVWFSRYDSSAGDPRAQPALAISVEHLPQGWTSERIASAKSTRALLRFSEWQSFAVRNAEGATAQIIRLAWDAHARTPAFATNHTPAICMPAAGWTLQEPPSLLTLEIRGTELPCAAYPFARGGTRILALQVLSAGGCLEKRLVDPAQIPGTFRRLATLWQEPLRQITEELLLYLPDPLDLGARKAAASSFLEALLVPLPR